MKKLFLTGAIFASSISQADTASVASANNHFGFDLYQSVKEIKSDKENVLVSPLSAMAALTMTLNGAEGQTKQEMIDALKLLDSDYNNSLSELLKNLQKKSSNSANVKEGSEETLSVANAIWSNKDIFDLNSDFVNTTNGFFNFSTQASLVRNEVFGTTALSNINSWVYENTNGMIPFILEELKKDDVAVLLNALYFQAQWLNTFVKTSTQLSFESISGEVVEVDAINSSSNVKYAEDDQVQAISIPFRTGTSQHTDHNGVLKDGSATGVSDIVLDIILPKDGVNIADVSSHYLNASHFDELTASMKSQMTITTLPVFEFDFESSLVQSLKALGMSEAFNEVLADFSKMGRTNDNSNVFISEVLQKTAIELDEKGLKAAAVTAVVMTRTTSVGINPLEIKVFKADRPFVFTLRDTKSNTILFTGQLGNPAK